MSDEVLRKKVHLQLNRGEARHELAKNIFFANKGELRSGDYFEIMNKASSLSILSNAILIHNTLHVEQILKKAESLGKPFSEESISRISPLFHNHIVVNGSYDFRKLT